MQLQIQVLSVILLVSLAHRSNALKCYTCSATENDADTSCADDVESLGKSAITDCDKKYCTITRIEYIDPKGKLSSVNRNCVDKVSADGIVEDSTFRTYQRSCKTELCNSGSGKGDSSGGKTSLGDKSTIYVPGTGRSTGAIVYASSLGLFGYLVIMHIINKFMFT